MRLVDYMVVYGVTSRHLTECAGVFGKLKDARKVYDSLELDYNFKAKRLIRLSYPNEWAAANDVRVLDEVIY